MVILLLSLMSWVIIVVNPSNASASDTLATNTGSSSLSERSEKKYGFGLAILLFLFCLRVIGQLVVANVPVPFLPPMEQWHSNLLPYPVLVLGQFAIIGLYLKVCMDVLRDGGFFAKPHPKLERLLTRFGIVYVLFMIGRYVVRMSMFPDERWFGGTIPIVFHFVLASFILLFADYQRKKCKDNADVDR